VYEIAAARTAATATLHPVEYLRNNKKRISPKNKIEIPATRQDARGEKQAIQKAAANKNPIVGGVRSNCCLFPVCPSSKNGMHFWNATLNPSHPASLFAISTQRFLPSEVNGMKIP
jgi:hypothetical protein